MYDHICSQETMFSSKTIGVIVNWLSIFIVGTPATNVSPGNFSIQRLASSESDESMGLDMSGDLSSPRTQAYPHPMTGHFGKFHEEAIDVVGMGNDGMHRVTS